MIMVRGVLTACIFALSQTVLAQFVPPRGVDCSNPDAPPPDPSCAFVFLEKAEQQLNDAYKKLLARLDDEGKTKLRASQRAWIGFRDADVALVVHHYGEGGSLGSSIAAYRSFQLTQQRAKELRDRLQDDGHW
jgi:uncharacterized protein YecT (DUF1311 family)